MKRIYLLVFAFVLLLAGCNGKDTNASVPNNNNNNSSGGAYSSTQQKPEQKSKEEVEKIKKNLRFGSVEGKEYLLYKLSNVDFAPISITTTKKIKNLETMGIFLLIELYVRNNTNEPLVLYPESFYIWETESNRKYELNTNAIALASTLSNKKTSPSCQKLNPGLETILILPFEVPNGFDYYKKAKLTVQFISGGKRTAINIKVRPKDVVLAELEKMGK